MTLIIVLLLAAILITLLGIWGKIPGCLLGILGFIIYVLLIAHTAEYIGGFWALMIWLGLPVVALLVFAIYETSQGRMDKWGNPK